MLGLWLTLFIATTVFAAEKNSICETPEYERGTCIPLRDCSELYELLQQERPLPAETVAFLRESQCGFENRQPLVCCRDQVAPPPTTTTTTTRRPTQTQSSVPRPKDVSRHRNVGLINPDLCGQSTDIRIVGGNKTSVFEFPWMTLLAYRSRNKPNLNFRCGGTVINERYILTAAHCIPSTKDLTLVSVRVGDHDTTKEKDCETVTGTVICAPPPQNIDVERSFVHPQYSPSKLINDIALLRLAKPIVMKENVRPICLPVGLAEQTKTHLGAKLVVAGWGATETGQSSSADLLKVFVPIVPVPKCHDVFSKAYKYNINAKQLCAGGSNKVQDSCTGDSGGPLKTFGLINGESSMIQYGVVSYGHRRCGTEGVPGVYTHVGYYMDWILDTMQP